MIQIDIEKKVWVPLNCLFRPPAFVVSFIFFFHHFCPFVLDPFSLSLFILFLCLFLLFTSISISILSCKFYFLSIFFSSSSSSSSSSLYPLLSYLFFYSVLVSETVFSSFLIETQKLGINKISICKYTLLSN